MKRSALYRCSCNSVELRLRTEPDGTAWLVIKRPGAEAQYVDIPDVVLAGVVDRFLAIGDDAQRFKAFINAVEAGRSVV